MSIDWPTLFLQTVNFIILVWLLQRFLYRPVLAAIDRRRAAVVAAEERAGAAEGQARAAEAEFHRRIEALEAEAVAKRRDAEAEAERRAAVLVAEGRAEAARIMAEAHQMVAAERQAATAALWDHAAEVATALAGSLMTEIASGSGARPFLVILLHRLAGLDPAERAILGHDTARIETAPALSPAEQEEWGRRLADDFATVDFAEQSALIAGARLTTASAVLEVSWADVLVKARKDMGNHAKPD